MGGVAGHMAHLSEDTDLQRLLMLPKRSMVKTYF